MATFNFEDESVVDDIGQKTRIVRDALLNDPRNPELHRAAEILVKAQKECAVCFWEISIMGSEIETPPHSDQIVLSMEKERAAEHCRKADVGLETLLGVLRPDVEKKS
jgi:hypothetical protein